MKRILGVTTTLFATTIVIGAAQAKDTYQPTQATINENSSKYHQRNVFENPREGRLDNRKDMATYGYKNGEYQRLNKTQQINYSDEEITYSYPEVAEEFKPTRWQSNRDLQAARVKSVGLNENESY